MPAKKYPHFFHAFQVLAFSPPLASLSVPRILLHIIRPDLEQGKAFAGPQKELQLQAWAKQPWPWWQVRPSRKGPSMGA